MIERRDFLRAVTGAALSTAGPETGKYLLLDKRVIERATGARLVPGQLQKRPPRPLFVEDKPWEPRFDNLYANVMYDEEEGLYKCWYSPFIVDPVTTNTPREKRSQVKWHRPGGPDIEIGVCYATSRDGLAWEKPRLGIVEFNRRRDNNLILRADPELGEPHGMGIAKDPREKDPARRYKAVFNRFHRKVDRTDPRYRYMCVGFSRDGIHWHDLRPCRDMEAPGDTHSTWFWCPERGRYVAITRTFDGQRLVARSESEDFVHWSRAEVILRGEMDRQTYAMPSFRYSGVYLGLLMILNRNGRYDTVDCELAWSPDSLLWERLFPGTPYIPRGPEGAYDSKCLFGAFSPVVLRDEIRVYYGANNGEHTDFRDGFFCLARLRPDGFAAMTADRTGEVITRAFRVGRNFRVTADADGGAIRPALLDGEGRVLAEGEPLRANVTAAALRWKERPQRQWREYARLRFQIEGGARLYSFELEA